MSLDPTGLTFVFTAGTFALLSPCGFPLLPGYISYYMGTKASLGRALYAGITCALGLLTIFSAIGIAVSIFGSFISQHIPILELIAGAATILLGVSMLVNIKFPIFFSKLKLPKIKGLAGIFLYGVVYGLATLGCSTPIFFSVFFYAVAAGGPLYGLVTFAVYALGMGLPIIVITVLVAKAKQLMLQKIVNVTPYLQKISGVVLIAIGIYLVYFYYTTF